MEYPKNKAPRTALHISRMMDDVDLCYCSIIYKKFYVPRGRFRALPIRQKVKRSLRQSAYTQLQDSSTAGRLSSILQSQLLKSSVLSCPSQRTALRHDAASASTNCLLLPIANEWRWKLKRWRGFQAETHVLSHKTADSKYAFSKNQAHYSLSWALYHWAIEDCAEVIPRPNECRVIGHRKKLAGIHRKVK